MMNSRSRDLPRSRESAHPLRAYYMRLHVAEAEEAQALASALREMLDGQPAFVLEEQPDTLSVLWAESEVDEDEEWDEQAYAELVFFLRSWSGDHPRRDLTILAEGLVDMTKASFRRAS